MADPGELRRDGLIADLIFFQALNQFPRVQIIANGVNDHTVPYPTASFDTVDPFTDWRQQGIEVQVDEDGVMQGWKCGTPQPKKRWRYNVGSLPPVLRYRFPFNYVCDIRSS
jgi:hypothetical protein